MKSSAIVRAILLLVLLFLAVAYGNDLRAKQGVQVSRWPNGNTRTSSQALRYPDGRIESDGAYEAFFPRGQAQLQGQYRHGVRSGRWKEWNENGDLLKEGYYRNGKMDGIWRYFGPDGSSNTIAWKQGHMLGGDDTSEVNDGETRSAVFSWGSHLLGLALTLLWLLASLPLLFALLDRSSFWAESWVALLCSWTAIQLSSAFVLSSLHGLGPQLFFVLQALLLCFGFSLWWRAQRPLLRLVPAVADSWEFLLAGVALILVLSVLAKTLLIPMTDWDGLAYHLPLMAQWIQRKGIAALPWLGQTSHYPLHWELLSLLGYFPFREDFLFGAPAVGAFALLGVSVYALARRVQATAVDAAASALLLLSLPLVLMQTEEIKSDLPLAAFFTAALVLGGFLDSTGRSRKTGLFFLSLGIMCGLKATGPAYVLVALLLVWIWKRVGRDGQKPQESLSSRSRAATWGALVAACALASFWYLRNFIELGNPLGLLEVRAFGHMIFPGELSGTNLARTNLFAVFQPFSRHDWTLAFANARQWLGIPMFALLVGAVAALTRVRRGDRRLAATLLLLCAIAAGGLLFGFTPFSGDNGTHAWKYSLWSGQAMRFALPKLAMAAVLGAVGWRILRMPRALLVGLSVVLCAWSVALRVALPRVQLIELVLFTAFVLAAWKLRRGPTTVVPSLLLVAVLLCLWTHSAREFRELHRREVYDLPYLHTLEASKDEVVGVASATALSFLRTRAHTPRRRRLLPGLHRGSVAEGTSGEEDRRGRGRPDSGSGPARREGNRSEALAPRARCPLHPLGTHGRWSRKWHRVLPPHSRQ